MFKGSNTPQPLYQSAPPSFLQLSSIHPSITPPPTQVIASAWPGGASEQNPEEREVEGEEGGREEEREEGKRGRANNKSPMTKPKSIKSQLSKHNCHTDERGGNTAREGGRDGGLRLDCTCGKPVG